MLVDRCTDTRTERTYEVIEERRAIRFEPCGVVSHNPNDIRERYCAVCHVFVEKEKEK
jgi:hypothetical protein